jgi:AraC family transcriptional regulator of adaptative response / DNA-3-methyladenine glycosylase II
VRSCGARLTTPILPITHRFPTPEALAEAARRRPQGFAMPAARRQTLGRLAAAVAEGEITIDPGADREELTRGLEAIPGIGPWTAGYIGMRAAGDPDAFIAGDLGVQRALAQLGAPHGARAAAAIAERWRPWRAYAVAHLWTVPIVAGAKSGVAAPPACAGAA